MMAKQGSQDAQSGQNRLERRGANVTLLDFSSVNVLLAVWQTDNLTGRLIGMKSEQI